MKSLPGAIIVAVLMTFAVNDVHGGLFDILIDIPSTLTKAFTQMFDDVRQYFRMKPTKQFPTFKRRNVMREISDRNPWPFKFDRPSSLNSDTSLIDLSESSSDMQSNLNYEGSQRIHDIMDENKYPNRIQHQKKAASRIYYKGRAPPAYDGLPYVPDNNVLI